jgi:uncharacterized protein
MVIDDIKKITTPIFKKHGIARVSVFGSVARGEEHTNSDVDLLVDLGETSMGMFEYMTFVSELEQGLQRSVDIVTPHGAEKFLAPYITHDLHTIYEE